MNKLIKRMKKLNRCSYLKLKAHNKEEKLYGFLSVISPIPKEKKINKRVILYHPIKRYFFIPNQFDNVFCKGNVVLEGISLNKETMKSGYSENPNIDDLKIMYEVSQKDMDILIEKEREICLNKFKREVNDFETRIKLGEGGK